MTQSDGPTGTPAAPPGARPAPRLPTPIPKGKPTAMGRGMRLVLGLYAVGLVALWGMVDEKQTDTKDKAYQRRQELLERRADRLNQREQREQ
ncbi:hypothetical protein HK105_202926 [Polyrhizophydium stewartii]|uniref:Uncharacterized protein n=1 Tax=Polyrhizophydium stewartii TaxID=2732419 RepID=A0ABR4NDJ7_9FUNG